ncbi:WEB family [Sesbania bispinosa]|nr:WEB family [Sesbania bispinosa]
MAESLETDADGYPATPDMREVRPETETGAQKLVVGNGSGDDPGPWIRRVGLRAEIDTSPPFGSVKEAVNRFGGSGPWIPLYKLGEAYNSIEDFDIKKVEEQAVKLEKDLIVKELETLDVLEELGATKAIVEELKQQLQTEALKQQIFRSPSPCSTPSPDMCLMELKQAKVKLGKTINELGMIQSSVETLNKKLKKERFFLERTRENLASKFAAISAQNVAKKEERSKPPTAPVETSCTFQNPQNVVRNFKSDAGHYNGMVELETRNSEVSDPLPEYVENGFNIKTAEMRWFAAKKMEEAAMAAEAVALAEIKALSSAEMPSGFAFPEHQKVTPAALGECSPLNPKFQIPEECTLKKEATEEVLRSKQVLAEALNSIETANRKQHAAEEALRRWIPEDGLKGRRTQYNSIKRNKFNQARNCQDLKSVLRSSVSMRDVLSRKQVPEEYTTTKEMEERTERNVALSQMLQALREDPNLPTKHEKDGSNQKQFIAQRKKFGFIQISLPLRKRSNKRT